ncbi:hypothetical protein EXIGLDRAFT_835616 [Exidia glandulosa HHB12029]|uniref:F-box domain-containing protein n=1 Tax=Exidia glandulosa HHB12029 TaxID=1314781 RepID=A0A165IL14_EXIGL|nr:hypothetical protein EXIGLDRAFT_835616 [Exidia glandulosa HHB12029]
MLSAACTRRLDRALEDIFRQAISENLSTASVTSEDIATALRQLCDKKLTACLRASTVALPQLPNETWGLIWQLLSLRDRVRVTHVSRTWRAIALGNSRLWSTLDLTSSLHRDDCECDECASAVGPHAKGHGYDVALARLSALLERSAGSPLTCSLKFIRDAAPTPPSSVTSISGILGPHAAALVSLTLVYRNDEWIKPFLVVIRDSSQLCHLELNAMRAPGPRSLISTIITIPILRLRHLNTGVGYIWDLNGSFFPALTRLEITFTAIDQVRAALHDCPMLQELRAHLELVELGPIRVYKEIASQCARLTRITLFQVPITWTREHVHAFAPDAATDVQLEYIASMRAPGSIPLHPAHVLDGPAEGTIVYSQLRGPIRFTANEFNRAVAIQLHDQTRCRKLSWSTTTGSMTVVDALWAAVDAASIVELIIPWELRGMVLGTIDSLPAVEHVIISPPSIKFQPPGVQSLGVHSSVWPAEVRATLPALSRVTISSGNFAYHGEAVSAHKMAKFIRSIMPERKLRVLTLRNVSIIGDKESIAALADQVITTKVPAVFTVPTLTSPPSISLF